MPPSLTTFIPIAHRPSLPPYFFSVQAQVIDPYNLLKHLPTSVHSSVKLLPLQSRPLHVVTLQSLSSQRQSVTTHTTLEGQEKTY